MNKLISKILIGVLLIAGCTSNSETQKVDIDAEKAAANEVLRTYKTAIESLNIDKTIELFSDDSQIFESGGNEGTYRQYVEHHLGPELKVFKSFKFSDYEIETIVDLPYAFATESYIYTIVLAEDEREIKKKGIATSVLKKTNGIWKIIKSHSSARRFKVEQEDHDK